MLIRLPDYFPFTPTIKKMERVEGVGTIFLHSEATHHVHCVSGDIKVYEPADEEDTTISILKVNQQTELRHVHTQTKEWTTEHEPIVLEPGLYHVGRQREYLPQGYQIVTD